MREYGQIQCSFWQKASEEGWSNDAMLLGAYLLTGPHSNGIGCYRLPDGYVSDDLGWTPERVSKGFAELFGKGFCNRFGTVVLIPKFLRWNPISNGNVAKARQQEFEAIPSEEAKSAAALALLEFGNHWANPFRNRLETLSKGFGKGYGKQEPTQPNPTQPEIDPSGLGVGVVSEDGDEHGDDDDVGDPGQLTLTPTVVDHPGGVLAKTVLDAYHETLPKCARINVLNPKRVKRIQIADKLARQVCRQNGWSYVPADFWRAYFEECLDDPWLRGETPNPNNPRWKQNLGVLIAEDRFAEIMDRAIDRMRQEEAA